MKRSLDFFRLVPEQTQNQILILDVQAQEVLEANPAAHEVLELGALPRPLDTLVDRQGMATLQDLLPVVRTGNFATTRLHVLTSKGGLETEASLMQLTDPVSRAPLRLALVLTDRTERGLAEEQRRQQEENLRQAQRLESLGVLAGGIAHDFNNLLTGILGHVSLARETITGGHPAHEDLEQIESAAQRAAQLCRQMLAFSGRGSRVTESIDLNQLLRDMSPLLQAAVSKRAVLTEQYSSALPGLEGDRSQLQQMVLNLVTNASEALGDSHGTIRLSTYPVGTQACLDVSDTGSGMDDQTRRRLGEPFFSTRGPGRGLGMAAVQGIARGHKATLEIESNPSRGTMVRVIFPGAPLRQGDETGLPSTEKGSTLVVVDDEPAVRHLACCILRRAGYQVLEAGTGEEGLELCAQVSEVKAVLLDLTLPGIQGEEVMRRLNQSHPSLRVILSSGYCDREQGPLPQGVSFLSKPYRAQELLALLEA